jgi:hypothetical protein
MLFFVMTFWLFSGSLSVLIAQSAVLSSSAAKIGTELSLVQTSSLHFGTMTRPSAAVNVTVSTANIRSASSSSAITLLPQAPVSSNAAYTVYGSKNAHYIVTLPSNNVVTISNGSNSMFVNNFTVFTTNNGTGSATGKLNLTGSDTFKVGATLMLNSAQPAGVYYGTFTVSVAYD